MSVFLFCFVDEPFFVAIVVSFARFRFMESKIEKQGHFFFVAAIGLVLLDSRFMEVKGRRGRRHGQKVGIARSDGWCVVHPIHVGFNMI
jgi:hypothetical protein